MGRILRQIQESSSVVPHLMSCVMHLEGYLGPIQRKKAMEKKKSFLLIIIERQRVEVVLETLGGSILSLF